MAIDVGSVGNVVAILAGQRQAGRLSAQRQSQNLIVLLLQQLTGCGGVELHMNAQLVHLLDHVIHELAQRPFEGGVLCVLEHAAQLTGLLVQGNIVASLGADPGKLHAGRAAANHSNLALLAHRLHHGGNAILHTNNGIDCADRTEQVGAIGSSLRPS